MLTQTNALKRCLYKSPQQSAYRDNAQYELFCRISIYIDRFRVIKGIGGVNQRSQLWTRFNRLMRSRKLAGLVPDDDMFVKFYDIHDWNYIITNTSTDSKKSIHLSMSPISNKIAWTSFDVDNEELVYPRYGRYPVNFVDYTLKTLFVKPDEWRQVTGRFYLTRSGGTINVWSVQE